MEYSVAVKVTQVGVDAVIGKINALEKALDLTRKTADTLRNSLSQLNTNIQFHINANDISNGTNSVNEMSNAVEELNRKIDQINTERFNQLNTNVGNITPAIGGATRSFYKT